MHDGSHPVGCGCGCSGGYYTGFSSLAPCDVETYPPHTTNPDPTGTFNPFRAYAAFYPWCSNRRLSRLHLREFEAQLLASLGVFDYFEGPGPDPMVNPGADSRKIWLRQNPGVQQTPGDIRVWNRTLPTSTEANWVPIDFRGFRRHLRLGDYLQHDQPIATTTWTITHDFGMRPLVQVYDDAWALRNNVGITQPSVNQVIVTSVTPITGHAIMSYGAPDDSTLPVAPSDPPELV